MTLKDEIKYQASELSKYLTVKKILEKVFSRYERPDYSITPGLICIDRCNLRREEFYIKSGSYNLSSYYYNNNSDKLIILCHGLKSGADDYIPFINFFFENGYDILSFNSCGTFESEGKSVFGMSRLLIDLDNVLNYVKNNNILNKKEIYLFGHSWGAFSVCAVLNLHKNIKKVASISGFYDASTIIVDTGILYGGELAGLPKKYIDMYQEKYFKDYLSYNAINGINSSNAKIFLAHGEHDLIINFKKESIMSHANEFINPNVIYYIGKNENDGHNSILYSKDALIIQEEVKKSIKRLKKEREELINYIKTINNYKYSEINYDLFNKILKFYNE